MLIALPLTFLSLGFGQSNTSGSIVDPQTASSQPVDQSPVTPPGSPAAVSDAADATNAGPKEGYLARWLDIDTFSESMRYRSTANSGGFHPFQFGQHRELLDGSFKLDKEGNTKSIFAPHRDATSTGPLRTC